MKRFFSDGGFWAYIALPVLIWFFISLGMNAGAWAQGASAGKGTFCQFGPDTMVVSPKIHQDRCGGTAHIQARSFGCIQNRDVQRKTQDYFREVVRAGRSICADHCAKRAPGCKGSFSPPAKCAMEIEPEHALGSGQGVGCRKDCAGPALSFCSLYAAGMMKVDPSLVVQQPPNCFCQF